MASCLRLIFYLLSFLIYVLISCNSFPDRQDGVIFLKFPRIDTGISYEYFSLDSNLGKDGIFINDTSFFLINIQKFKRNFLFYEYSRQTKKNIGRYVKWGTSSGTAYAPISNGLYKKNKLWLHDKALQKVIIISLNKKYSVDSVIDMQEFSVPGFAYSTQLMDSNRLLQSGMFTIPQYLQVMDIGTSQPIKRIGNFDPPNDKYPFYTWKGAYESFLFLQPNEKKAALACRYSDRVVFIDIAGDSTLTPNIVNGPINFPPKFKMLKNPSVNNYLISRNSKTVFGFIDGAVTNKYLYLLFSGKKETDPNYYFSNIIFIYNWEGSPIRQINLDRYVSSIAVDNDSIIYAIDPINNKLIKSIIK